MSDTAAPTVAPPAANTPEARTSTGEIKPATSPTPPTPPERAQPDAPPAEATPAAKAPAEGEGEERSLLNERGEKGVVPEKYEFALPEGYALDETVAGEVNDLFKGLGLDQPGAQKLMDFYVNKANEAAEAPYKLWVDTQKQWINEVKADPELGRRLPEVKATVSRAIDGLGDPKLAAAFREAMDITGAGNHPAFIRAFYKLAQQVTEGRHVSGRGPAEVAAPDAKPRTAAQALFPGLPSAG